MDTPASEPLFAPGQAPEGQFTDEVAFMEALLGHIAARLDAGETHLEVDLTGVLSMPETFFDALVAAVDTTAGAGGELTFVCSPELATALDDAGHALTIPHSVVMGEGVADDEPAGPVEIKDGKLVAHALDDAQLIEAFERSFEELAGRQGEIRIDLRNLPYLSPELGKTLVLFAIQARELDKPFRVEVTAAQERVLRILPGAAFMEFERQATAEPSRGEMPTYQAPAEDERERRQTLRLRIENAFVVISDARAPGARLRTRLLDISRGGLSFLSEGEVAIGRTLTIYLELPAFLPPTRVIGEVVRCRKVLHDGEEGYRTGVQYVDRPHGLDWTLRDLEQS